METTITNPHDEIDDYRIMPAWCAFVLGGVTTFLLVYLGIARPAAHQLDMMRRQMGALEQTVWQVAGSSQDVAEATSLLKELNVQRSQIAKARLAVQDLKTLREKLQREASHLQEALATVAELGAIKESLLSYSGEIHEAAEVVSVSEDLCVRLAHAATSTYEALQASDDLLAMKDDLLAEPQSILDASDSLTNLLNMRDRLTNESTDLATAESTLDGLVSLKSSVLAQQSDMVTTLETLEVIQDLAQEFDQAAVSFERIRHWMVEVVASESILERARQTLAPLSEIANLRHLEPAAVRTLVSQLTNRDGQLENADATVETASIQESDLVIE